MRIGHFTIRLAEPGGVGSYVRMVGEAQREAGHDVLYFERRRSGDQASANPEASAVQSTAELYERARRLELDVLHVHTLVSLPPPSGLRVVRTVHVHDPFCLSGSQFLARSRRPCERVFALQPCLARHLTEHCGSIRPHRLAAEFKVLRAERSTLPHLTVLAVSRFMKQRMIQAGYVGDRVHVVHNPAPDVSEVEAGPRPSQTSQQTRFLFAGRVTPSKGLSWLIRSFAQVRGHPILDVAGDGRALVEAERLAAMLGVDHRIHFHGWVGQDQLASLFDGTEALVMPSLGHESAGLVALEAMSHARAVIASRAGGLPEYVEHGQSGLLVPPGNEKALVDALSTIAKDRTLSTRMGLAGRERARGEFSLSRHLSKLQSLYRLAAPHGT